MTVWYMNGAGNNFAVIDARNICIDMSRAAKLLCENGKYDGFMALDKSAIADFKLHFYNNDGSRAEMCGNGARCICRFAYDNGITEEKMTIETDAGIVEGERLSECLYRIRLNDAKGLTLDKEKGLDFVTVGVPHVIIKLDELEYENASELFKRARKIRYEQNANVNFYCKINESTVKILTYERGVEDFTKACGTGSGALAAILFERKIIDKNEVTVKNRGGDLKVTLTLNGALYLEGRADVDAKNEKITV